MFKKLTAAVLTAALCLSSFSIIPAESAAEQASPETEAADDAVLSGSAIENSTADETAETTETTTESADAYAEGGTAETTVSESVTESTTEAVTDSVMPAAAASEAPAVFDVYWCARIESLSAHPGYHNGSDANTGLTADSPVYTFEKVMEIANTVHQQKISAGDAEGRVTVALTSGCMYNEHNSGDNYISQPWADIWYVPQIHGGSAGYNHVLCTSFSQGRSYSFVNFNLYNSLDEPCYVADDCIGEFTFENCNFYNFTSFSNPYESDTHNYDTPLNPPAATADGRFRFGHQFVGDNYVFDNVTFNNFDVGIYCFYGAELSGITFNNCKIGIYDLGDSNDADSAFMNPQLSGADQLYSKSETVTVKDCVFNGIYSDDDKEQYYDSYFIKKCGRNLNLENCTVKNGKLQFRSYFDDNTKKWTTFLNRSDSVNYSDYNRMTLNVTGCDFSWDADGIELGKYTNQKWSEYLQKAAVSGAYADGRFTGNAEKDPDFMDRVRYGYKANGFIVGNFVDYTIEDTTFSGFAQCIASEEGCTANMSNVTIKNCGSGMHTADATKLNLQNCHINNCGWTVYSNGKYHPQDYGLRIGSLRPAENSASRTDKLVYPDGFAKTATIQSCTFDGNSRSILYQDYDTDEYVPEDAGRTSLLVDSCQFSNSSYADVNVHGENAYIEVTDSTFSNNDLYGILAVDAAGDYILVQRSGITMNPDAEQNKKDISSGVYIGMNSCSNLTCDISDSVKITGAHSGVNINNGKLLLSGSDLSDAPEIYKNAYGITSDLGNYSIDALILKSHDNSAAGIDLTKKPSEFRLNLTEPNCISITDRTGILIDKGVTVPINGDPQAALTAPVTVGLKDDNKADTEWSGEKVLQQTDAYTLQADDVEMLPIVGSFYFNHYEQDKDYTTARHQSAVFFTDYWVPHRGTQDFLDTLYTEETFNVNGAGWEYTINSDKTLNGLTNAIIQQHKAPQLDGYTFSGYGYDAVYDTQDKISGETWGGPYNNAAGESVVEEWSGGGTDINRPILFQIDKAPDFTDTWTQFNPADTSQYFEKYCIVWARWTPVPDLAITKQINSAGQLVQSNQVRPGDNVDYTITVTNSGGDARQVNIEDALAQHIANPVTSKKYSLRYISDDSGGTNADNKITWNIPVLRQGESKVINLKTQVIKDAA